MVRISDEFKREVQEEIKESAMPERGATRKLLKTGGRFCVTLRPDWCRQWGVEVGSKVLLFIDEDERLCITPATDLWRREMGKYYDLIERQVVEVGNSLAVSVPKDILEEDLGWEKKKLLRHSDYATVYEPFDLGRQREEYRKMVEAPEAEEVEAKEEAKVEEVGEEEPEWEKRPRKVLAASAIAFGIAMAVFIGLQGSEGPGSWKPGPQGEWAGTFHNTVAAGGALQLKPKFMESCENGWSLISSDGKLAVENWSGWYTEGKGSVAVGETSDEWKLYDEAIVTKQLPGWADVDTILIDIYGQRAKGNYDVSQELWVGGTIERRWTNKDFEETIRVNVTGSLDNISLKVKNTSGLGGGFQPAPTLAADFIRSEELADKNGTHTTIWHDMGGRKSWDNLRAVTSIDNDMWIKTTLEVSNDRDDVIDESEEISLDNGTNTYDISALESARYVRFKTELHTEDITRSPKVLEYEIA